MAKLRRAPRAAVIRVETKVCGVVAQKTQSRFNKLPRQYAMIVTTVIRQSTCPNRFKKNKNPKREMRHGFRSYAFCSCGFCSFGPSRVR
jgi:hypothetical protein